ncbi:MAG: helix-turn-helix domain-containing protein [Verrucomicrobiota bacterium]
MHTQDYSNRLALTRGEASELLGLSAVTIDRLTKRGLLRPSRATRRPLYAIAELHRFLNESTADLPSSSPGANGIGGNLPKRGGETDGKVN